MMFMPFFFFTEFQCEYNYQTSEHPICDHVDYVWIAFKIAMLCCTLSYLENKAHASQIFCMFVRTYTLEIMSLSLFMKLTNVGRHTIKIRNNQVEWF